MVEWTREPQRPKIAGAGRSENVKLKAMTSCDLALAGCRSSAEARANELYPDPDAAPLQEALRSLGVTSELVAWDDPDVGWGSYSQVVISSTWDGVDHPGPYLAWARRVAAVSHLVNPLPVIEWDFDKVHHKELAAAGVPIVPTIWVDPASRWAPPTEADFVVKPSVSAGGRDTAHYRAGDPRALEHVRRLQALGRTVMVQDYVSRVDDEGETDLVFFDRVFSHAVAKRFVLKRGEGVIDRPWERMSWAGLVRPSPAQLAVAAQTLAFVVDQLGYQLPYARIDLVAGPEGDPLVLEVELIDPYLSLDIEPLAAERFAGALVRPAAGVLGRPSQ